MNKINQILYKFNKIFQKNSIGINGSINESNFIKLKENNGLLSDYCEYDEDVNEEDLKTNNIYIIWNNYKNAMNRRREGNALNLCSFYDYIMYNANVFNYKNSYILGNFSNGFYKPSHFAPTSIREGMEMIEELCKYNNIIFTVTPDLTNMLKKMGAYTDTSFSFPMIFRDELTIKNIVTTNYKVLEVILNKMKKNEIEELYNLNFEDVINSNKEDKFDKYLKYHDKYSHFIESIIKEEYNNIINESKEDLINKLLDNNKLNYLENKLFKFLSNADNVYTYKDILNKFLDSLNLEYYEEKINSFGKEVNVEYLLDTKTKDVNLVFSLEENKTTVYILYKYYTQLFNIFKDFIDENNFDNLLIKWCRKNINNRINKISLSFDNEININESDYRGPHQAPKRTNDVGSPLYDVRNIFGKDFYEFSAKELARQYGSGHSYDQLLASIILRYKDKPDEKIKIYRAIPDFNKEYKDKIKDLKNILSYYNQFNFYPPRNKYKKYADIVDEYENIIKNENNNIEYDELKNEIYNRIVNEISTLESKKQKYTIEKGDWVTIIKDYAVQHGKREFDNYIILTKIVRADELFTEGYMEEWGYDPN